jgi:hypothetical protein
VNIAAWLRELGLERYEEAFPGKTRLTPIRRTCLGAAGESERCSRDYGESEAPSE